METIWYARLKKYDGVVNLRKSYHYNGILYTANKWVVVRDPDVRAKLLAVTQTDPPRQFDLGGVPIRNPPHPVIPAFDVCTEEEKNRLEALEQRAYAEQLARVSMPTASMAISPVVDPEGELTREAKVVDILPVSPVEPSAPVPAPAPRRRK